MKIIFDKAKSNELTTHLCIYLCDLKCFQLMHSLKEIEYLPKCGYYIKSKQKRSSYSNEPLNSCSINQRTGQVINVLGSAKPADIIPS